MEACPNLDKNPGVAKIPVLKANLQFSLPIKSAINRAKTPNQKGKYMKKNNKRTSLRNKKVAGNRMLTNQQIMAWAIAETAASKIMEFKRDFSLFKRSLDRLSYLFVIKMKITGGTFAISSIKPTKRFCDLSAAIKAFYGRGDCVKNAAALDDALKQFGG